MVTGLRERAAKRTTDRAAKASPELRNTPEVESQLTIASFTYEGIDSDGKLETGELLATSERDVVERIRRLGLRPTSVRRSTPSVFERELTIPGLGPRVKPAELAVMARQFSTMVSAGIPLIRALTVLTDQADNPVLRRTLAEMRVSVASGDSLSQAMERHPKVFDRLFVSMVRAGEVAGALDAVLVQLADALERNVAVRQKLKSAMSYPIAVLVMVVLVVAAMLVFVVPVFTGIYEDLGGTLPLPTRVLVLASSVLTTRLPVVLVVGLVVGLAFRSWRSTPSGRMAIDRAKLRLPLIGPLIHKGALARIGRTLSVLIGAGVPVLETLKIASDTAGNQVVASGLDEASEGVRRGESIASNLSRHQVFPSMVVQLVTVGEETGSLEEMLTTIGSTYDNEVEAAVSGFAALIEPLLMAVIGLVVGGMVIALYLPMFRIIDLVQ